MDRKKIIGFGATAVLLICLITVVITAATTGGEASKVDGMLKQAVNSKSPIATAVSELKELGYTVSAPDTSGTVKAQGPGHWALIYGTWLTVSMDSRQDQTMSGYHIDRASAWF